MKSLREVYERIAIGAKPLEPDFYMARDKELVYRTCRASRILLGVVKSESMQ